jgi:hypothetical protein
MQLGFLIKEFMASPCSNAERKRKARKIGWNNRMDKKNWMAERRGRI